METVTILIIASCIAIVSICVSTIYCVHRLDATTEQDATELVGRVAMRTEIDHMYEKITIIHERIANLGKRIEPIGFQEVLTKHADEIAAMCCMEYSKLSTDGQSQRHDCNN